jgi:hypothetical protein
MLNGRPIYGEIILHNELRVVMCHKSNSELVVPSLLNRNGPFPITTEMKTDLKIGDNRRYRHVVSHIIPVSILQISHARVCFARLILVITIPSDILCEFRTLLAKHTVRRHTDHPSEYPDSVYSAI